MNPGFLRLFAVLGVALSLVLAGCGGPTAGAGGAGGAGGSGSSSDSEESEPSWWRPRPGAAADWDWQISEPYDVAAPRAMYDLDLFDLATAGSRLRYPDAEPIPVSEGPLAGTVEKLHRRTPRPIVICYVDTGAFEHYRPDAARFPGYRDRLHAIPNRPAKPEKDSVIGRDTGWDGERWLDIRAESRDAFAHLIWARFDLAHRLGCDGVEPDQNNPRGNDPGFPITRNDQIGWYREVARQAHRRGLSVGMKNGHDEPRTAAALVDHFD